MAQKDVGLELKQWVAACKPLSVHGRLATYIPALERADPQALGVYVLAEDGSQWHAGDCQVPFTLQSVSKVINFMAACESQGLHEILENVDVEPTGDAFDSIIRLEAHKPGKPFNPMINAGAITVASMLPGTTALEKFRVFSDLLELMIGRHPKVNEDVYASEWEHGHRNRALAHYLKGLGYLSSEVDVALEVYIRECSVEVTAEEIARIGLILGTSGFDATRNLQLVSKDIAQITKSLMVTCGTYNASGNMAAFVGIPLKSGVSGAIMGAVPARSSEQRSFSGACGIGIYGPALDEFGNSIAGVALLKQISKEWDLSIW